MSRLVKLIPFLLVAVLVACESQKASAPKPLGLGTPVTENQIAAWDIDVGPDGVGLPRGSGTSKSGEPVFLAKCAACHGEFCEGMGRFPALISERSSLSTDRPSKTVGSYWAHATTLYDYIYRTMPFGNAQSLTPDEVYGLTAYILAMNSIIAEDEVMNADTLPRVEMPNRDGFVIATDTDIKVDACMQGCVDEVRITSRASRNKVSAENGE